jgi:hypothetical protein
MNSIKTRARPTETTEAEEAAAVAAGAMEEEEAAGAMAAAVAASWQEEEEEEGEEGDAVEEEEGEEGDAVPDQEEEEEEEGEEGGAQKRARWAETVVAEGAAAVAVGAATSSTTSSSTPLDQELLDHSGRYMLRYPTDSAYLISAYLRKHPVLGAKCVADWLLAESIRLDCNVVSFETSTGVPVRCSFNRRRHHARTIDDDEA